MGGTAIGTWSLGFDRRLAIGAPATSRDPATRPCQLDAMGCHWRAVYAPYGRYLSSVAVLFLLGLIVSSVMVARSQVGGDQIYMLYRGWLFAHGDWVQLGMRTSAGGKSPGGAIAALTGAPLLAWMDYRAPVLLILLSHAAAFFILDRVLRRTLSPTERVLFAVLYWLNPWRLYFSAHVLNSNWLFLFGAVHLATAWAQRSRPSFVHSLLHVAMLGLFVQVHTSFVVLVLASAVLVARGVFKPSWPGVALGAGLSLLAVVPWLEEAVADPSLVPGGKGFPGRGLLYVFPLLRGIGYWLRYGSLSFSGTMVAFDFEPVTGLAWGRTAGITLGVVAVIVGVVSLAIPLLAARRFLRSARFLAFGSIPPDGRRWLRVYVLWTAAGTVLSFALSPTTIMMWQGFSVLHAAVLPVVWWLAAMLRSRNRRTMTQVMRWHLAALLVLLACMAVAAPMYRIGGRDPVTQEDCRDLPMYRELGILDHTSVEVVPDGEWVPDLLR